MNTVEPIRDIKDIENMKKVLKGRNRLMFITGINSALRISDLLSLKVYDVIDDFGRPRNHVQLKEEKTGKTKIFRLNDVVRAEIKKQVSGGLEEPLFPSRKGNKAISRVQAYRILRTAADTIGLENIKIGTHTMRKTFGYHAYNNGTPLERLQLIFNHASPNETLGYIGITQENIDEVYINISL